MAHAHCIAHFQILNTPTFTTEIHDTVFHAQLHKLSGICCTTVKTQMLCVCTDMDREAVA